MSEPTGPSPIEKKILSLALGNREIVKRLDKMGFDTTNVKDNHVQFFIDFLIQQRILTAEQVWDFQLQWETHLSETLVSLELKAKQMLEEMRLAQIEQRRKEKLIVPGRPRRTIRDT